MGIFEEGLKAGIQFYGDPEDLDLGLIDELLRETVSRINRSGWVWTAESCQGHPDDATGYVWAGNTNPMLRLVCRMAQVAQMLEALYTASTVLEDEDGLRQTFCLRVYPESHGDWAEILVYVEAATVHTRNRGLQVFAKFAEIVTPES